MGIFGKSCLYLSIYCVYGEGEGVYLGILPSIKKSRFGTMKDRRIETTLKSTGFVLGLKKEGENLAKRTFFYNALIFNGLNGESIRMKNDFLKCRTICKPGSVIGDHSSAAFVAKRL